MVVAFRRHTLLPLDDCLYALQPTIPHLTRFARSLEPVAFTGSLSASMSAAAWDLTLAGDGWRQVQETAVQALPDRVRPPHSDRWRSGPHSTSTSPSFGQPRASVRHGPRTDGGTMANLFVAIDRTSTFAVAQPVEKADRKTAWEFLELLLETVPYQIHTILTDNHCPAGDLPSKSAERGHPVRRAAAQPQHGHLAANAVRHDLRGRGFVRHGSEDNDARDRSSADQTEPPVEFGGKDNRPVVCCPDKRPCRTHEPHDQGRWRRQAIDPGDQS